MPTCNFFFVNKSLSISCYIIWKGDKSFSESFCDSVDFISIILQGGVIWVYWDFIGFCYESRCARITGGGGSSIVKVPGDVPPARVYFFGLLV